MAGKMVFSIDQIEDCFIVTRQVQVDTDKDGNAIFESVRRSRETLQLAVQEIRVSLDSVLKQAEKDEKASKTGKQH